ncbi:MAG: hypothetical protein A3H35_09485 [Betaproteobacteria bacterium RIFCSPLOWO2_02_FULL_62_17]|nr:MAG: hypothetical protein A3H35_09485 [Betaproteobacteria bacterium RIFCSPLOWO2_02_FULL_62_17]
MVTIRHTLEVALAKAEANLQHAVTRLANVGGDRAIASDNLDKARASCRNAHAALTKLDHAER